MDTSLCSYSFHRRLEAGQHDVFQYITDCAALGCQQLDLWNGHLPSLLDEDGRVGRRTLAELPDSPEPVTDFDPASLLLPDELAFLDQVRAAASAASAAGLPMGCLAVDGAHLYEPTEELRALHRQRASRWCQIAARLGAQQIRIDTGGPESMPPEVFALIVAGYGDLIGRAGQLGLEVVMENHWGASRIAANVVQILEAVPDLGLLFDSGNWPPGTHATSWELCARYATATHIKTRAFDDAGNETTWDVPTAVRLLLDGGYDGSWGVESVPSEGDEFEAARKSLGLVRRLVSVWRLPNAGVRMTRAAPDKVRLGLIGSGQRGQDHLRKYHKVPNAEIVAVADVNEALARAVAAEHGIPHIYTDYRQLLKRDDLDAVDICLHNNLHRPVAVAAMEASKDVYCEKPMAGSYADALAMHTAAQSLGRRLSIQLLMLFQPETRAAKALVDAGALGELYHARSTGFRRRGRPFVDGYGTPTFVQKRHSAGGALYDMGIYHLSALLYLLGNPAVERMTGQIYQKMPMDAARQAASGYDVEELGLGFVHFAGGLTLDLIEAWAIQLDSFEGSSLVGSLGGVRLKPFGYFHTLADLDLNSTADLDAWLYRAHNVHGEGDEYDGAEQHWVAALQGRVPLLPTAELALNTMLICEGIYLSSHLGREVTADEVKQRSLPIDPS